MPARALPARPWRVFRLGRALGQTSDHARQDSLPRGLRDIHSGNQDDRPGEHLQAIPRNCVAFCVADGLDPLLSRTKPRLFGSCPRHFLHAGRAVHGPGGLFFLGRHPAACRFWLSWGPSGIGRRRDWWRGCGCWRAASGWSELPHASPLYDSSHHLEATNKR